MYFHFINMKEKQTLVLILFFKLSYVQLLASNTMIENRYIMESAFYRSIYTTVSDVNSSIECAMLCSRNPYCCSYTQETTSGNCLLFHYQTSNNFENKTETSISLYYVKQLTDCNELLPGPPSGVYRINPSRQSALLVYCEMTDAGGGWTVVQRRQDGSQDFFLYWADYKEGFGDLNNEFWLGNDIIHRITSQKQYKVRFDLEDFDGLTAYAEYDNFYLDNETMGYVVNGSGYSGTAGTIRGDFDGTLLFSTRDVDNDRSPGSCADGKKSGWWFKYCSSANINGIYEPGISNLSTIHWGPWKGYQCLSKTRMMIKPS